MTVRRKRGWWVRGPRAPVPDVPSPPTSSRRRTFPGTSARRCHARLAEAQVRAATLARFLLLALAGCSGGEESGTEGPSPCEVAADRVAARYAACGLEPRSMVAGCSSSAGATAMCVADCHDAACCSALAPDPDWEEREELLACIADC